MLSDGREQVLEHHRERDIPWKGDKCRCISKRAREACFPRKRIMAWMRLSLEACAYGVARAFDPFLVNSVVGFIGPDTV